MDGRDRPGVAAGLPQFVVAEGIVVGGTCALDDAAVRHVRALRLAAGALVGVRDGAGRVGVGQLVSLTKSQAHLEITDATEVPPLPAVHLLVPVADRDRMLWLAEKAAELGATSWRPVLWRRSRSVAPRGEGVAFQGRVRARMEGALAQSEGAWLPQPFPEATLERAVLAAPPGDRIVLDPGGPPLVGHDAAPLREPVVIAIGPEGGLERDELAALGAAGFRAASLGPTILRFETAALAALAIARTSLGVGQGNPPTESTGAA
ncbi:MAG: 16S rRNA (uracil(1498)-N(3))-methyltransferase [Gemmatimonadetes bacterium]|nr:16S rRNA (uracil(1498)-N(3))-methyltransferase [Gemmatimonadota bacterium]